jgi:16S rRNA (cytidine1402-2'-O)-methyltransferase
MEASREEKSQGTLYIVGTPIGNLEDMTFRAIRILQIVDAIAAEDTRHTGKLLHHFQIKTPQISYHQHNIQSRIPQLIERLQRGENLALVTDAGMPCISDPGYELVKACAEASIQVIPIPGPTAAITALAASGLPSDRFCFEGFLPVKGKERREYLAAIQQESRTLIFYEAPHRLRQTLQDFLETIGTERAIVISRELTKLHETFWRGTVAEAITYFQQEDPRGEYTLILAGADRLATAEPTEAEIMTALQTLLEKGISRSQASKEIAKLLNLSKREVYQLALTLGDGEE